MAKMAVGMKMPDFSYQTAWKQEQDFYEAAKGRKTVLRFLRYYGCPVCQLDLWELAEEYQRFVDAGANLFVVMQSAPETIRGAVEEGELPYDLILDPSMSLYQMLEIGDMPKRMKVDGRFFKQAFKMVKRGIKHGKYEGNEQQAPAMFIMDEDMNVTYAHYGRGPVDVPSIDETIALLK